IVTQMFLIKKELYSYNLLMNDLDISLMSLLINNTEPLKSAELAFTLGVSEKTILKHLNSLKKTLRTYGASIEIKQGSGSYITIHDQKLFDEFLKNMSHNLNLDNPNIRKAYILLRLLCSSNYIDPYEFADELYISPSLLRQTIKGLVPTLDKYNLQIDHHHNKGYKIAGEENDIRQCLSKECSNLNDFNEVMNAGDFKQTKLELIQKIVTESLDHYHVAISKNGISSLTLHILIAINRMETENLIEIDHSKLISTKIMTSPEYFVASRIGKSIHQQLGIDMPENELAYLTIHITGKQRIYGHEKIQVKLNQDALVFYNKFLRNIYKMANEDFFDDNELRISLLNHIVPFLNRYSNRMMIAKTDLPNI
ncbi:MAG: PRD domain-containing protein, partial [Erysipelotrichaceae bacterium]|nr:PRD domain-containing protein [Erysipelotrichaceae bacterium]